MSNVFNDPKELQKFQTILNLLNQSGNNEKNNLLSFIESAKSSGNLESENYEQLISSEYLGDGFQEEHNSAYTEQTKKMGQYLSELEKKLNEYSQIS